MLLVVLSCFVLFGLLRPMRCLDVSFRWTLQGRLIGRWISRPNAQWEVWRLAVHWSLTGPSLFLCLCLFFCCLCVSLFLRVLVFPPSTVSTSVITVVSSSQFSMLRYVNPRSVEAVIPATGVGAQSCTSPRGIRLI